MKHRRPHDLDPISWASDKTRCFVFRWWSRGRDGATKICTSKLPLVSATGHHVLTQTWRCQKKTHSIVLLPPPCFLQSLLTGLMYYRPDDPIDYLEGCLIKARELGGPDKVRWDTFVGQDKKSLPPLNGGQSRRSLFRNGEQHSKHVGAQAPLGESLDWSGNRKIPLQQV